MHHSDGGGRPPHGPPQAPAFGPPGQAHHHPQGYGPAPAPYGQPQGYGPTPAPPHGAYGPAPTGALGPPAGGFGQPPAGYGQPPIGWGAPPNAGAGWSHAGQAPTVAQVACPQCNEPTASLKQYTMLRYMVFVWFFAFWGRKRVTCCPACMRKELGLSTLINLVPANLLWPVLVLPWHAVLFCMTFSEGHSDSVKQALQRPG